MTTDPTAILDPTAATEPMLDIDSIKELMDGFDPASLLPELRSVFDFVSGYRTYFGMGSVEAWRFTQRLAGAVLGGVGLVLTGVMLFISGGFAGMNAMDMVWKAFWCLIWQAAIILAANAAIWAVTFFRFDAKGNYRAKKKTAK